MQLKLGADRRIGAGAEQDFSDFFYSSFSFARAVLLDIETVNVQRCVTDNNILGVMHVGAGYFGAWVPGESIDYKVACLKEKKQG